MKPILLIAGLMTFCVFESFAQAPGIQWEKTFGGTEWEAGYSVSQTTDGGYIVTGYTESYGAGQEDIYLIKTDSYGNTIWTRTFGDTMGDHGFSVQQIFDDGYIVAGITSSYGAGSQDAYLIRTTSSGDTVWTRTFGGSGSDQFYSARLSPANKIVATGSTRPVGGNCDVFLVQTDPFGNTIWTRTFGGTGHDYASSVDYTSDGGWIVAGSTWSFGAGASDFYLIKTNDLGDTQWSATYGTADIEAASCVQQTTDGGYIVAGYTESSQQYSRDVYVVKTDNNGNIQWTETYGGANNDFAHSIQQTADEGYIIAGVSYSSVDAGGDAYVIKIDSEGNVQWTETYGGTSHESAYSIQQTADGGYILSGTTTSNEAGNYDVYLIKLEPPVGTEESYEVEIETYHTVSLEPISPNPSFSNMNITYGIPAFTNVELSVVDLAGRLVERLISDQLPAGCHTTIWIPSVEVPSGCYLVVLEADGQYEVRRCLRLN